MRGLRHNDEVTDGKARLLWDRWRARGEFVEIDGQRLFFVDAGPREAPSLLILHGFPCSSLDYHRTIDELSNRFRVVVHDQLGFGLSSKPKDSSYTLAMQADLAEGLWRELGIERGVVLGHDYGTSVATELLARREENKLRLRLDGLILTNGSVLIEMARLRLSQRIARSRLLGPLFVRWMPRGYFKNVLRRLWGDQSLVDEADLDAIWLALAHENGRRRMHAISGYIRERYEHRERWVGALSRLDVPSLVLWGDQDPIAVPEIALSLARTMPRCELRWLARTGHFPMLESPLAWCDAVSRFMSSASGHASPHPG